MNSLIIVMVFSSSAIAMDLEVFSVTPEYHSTRAKATLPVGIQDPDLKSVRSTLQLLGELNLSAESIRLNERFRNRASLDEYLKSTYCGILKKMTGHFVYADKKALASVSAEAKVNQIRIDGVNEVGQKLYQYTSCF